MQLWTLPEVRLDKVQPIVYNSCQGNPAGLSTMRIRSGHRTGGRNRQPLPFVWRCGKRHPARFQKVVAEMQRPFVLRCAGNARRGCQSADGTHGKENTHRQRQKPSDTRCRGLGALSCSDFVEVNRIVWLKCCARRVLHVQRVWDAAQQVLARQEGFV